MTTTDIDELERILIESDELGTNEDYENAYGEQKDLSLLTRSLFGMERKEVMQEFNESFSMDKMIWGIQLIRSQYSHKLPAKLVDAASCPTEGRYV